MSLSKAKKGKMKVSKRADDPKISKDLSDKTVSLRTSSRKKHP